MHYAGPVSGYVNSSRLCLSLSAWAQGCGGKVLQDEIMS